MKRADKKNKKKATTRKKVVALPLIKLKKSNKVKVSKTEKQRKEKLRIAKITATWARKSYQKLLQIKKPTGAQKNKGDKPTKGY